ncbi:hypothetical protein TNCV_1841811 [Trichonephila clavipes]|nr:hypothetical protein TNCV_1841811 [Trichonephila clavipes]
MCSNKSSMLAEATTIHAVKSITIATGVSYISDFRWPQKKKSKGMRCGQLEGQATGSPSPIHFPGYVTWWWLRTAIEKCAGAPSCTPARSVHISILKACFFYGSNNGMNVNAAKFGTALLLPSEAPENCNIGSMLINETLVAFLRILRNY